MEHTWAQSATFYKWIAKYGCMKVAALNRHMELALVENLAKKDFFEKALSPTANYK